MDLTLTMITRVVVAALLGAVLGFERSRAGQAAGVRTNLMISVAACLFTFLGAEVFSTEPGMGPRDPARVAAQIVTGVGFLGAGTLLQTKNKIRGLTTAATIWLVAAVGMAVGVGFYSGAIFVTIFAVVALIVLAPVSEYLSHEASEERKLKKRVAKEEEEKLKEWWIGRRDDQDEDDEDHHVTIED
jgi:putative Mg2+ transporter-C (MgtC) family protein